MGAFGTLMRGGPTLLALACAAAVGASASTPAADGWRADPEEQFLLDVAIRQWKLGDGVRAYQTPTGTCVLFGDFVTALNVPVEVDLAKRRASGWAFKESHRIAVDQAAMTVSYGAKSEPIAPGTLRETPDGWCVSSAALARWFGIGVKPVTSGSVLMLESEAKLPVELARERQLRADRIKPAKFSLDSLPQVKIPYRMWRTPALDFVVSGGVTYRAKDGVRVDRRTSVYAAGEIAHLSYDALAATDEKGRPNALRLHAYRTDPEGGLLGPLHATHFGVGDVEGFDSRLSGNAIQGRGALVTNRPVHSQATFDRARFEGDLPSGWEAEIYRNGELLGFAKSTPSGRYVFDDVQLIFGENQVSVVLYGPQGQIRTRDELINVGQEQVPPGKTYYWAGFNQPARDVLGVDKPPGPELPKAQAAVSVEHGLDARTSVGALARAMLIDDQRVTFVEGTVRRSLGPALVEVAGARESTGGMAARAHAIAKIGTVSLSAEALVANDFHLRGGRPQSVKEVRGSVDAPLRIGRRLFPVHGSVRLSDRGDGTRHLDAAARLSASFDRFNLGTTVSYNRQFVRGAGALPAQIDVATAGSGRFGDVRVRGSTLFEVAPQARLRAAEISAYWSASDTVDWEGGVAYEALAKRARARVSHIRRLDSMAIALTGETATDGSVAVGFNLNFSLDPSRGLNLSRRPLASAGAIQARVYRDLNDNGLRDVGEPDEKGALVTTGTRTAEKPTDGKGSVLVGGLATYTPVAVGIDATSLSDPMLVPKKALQVVVPRPGVPAVVEIGLVGGGDIEGALVKSGGIGFEGIDLQLLDPGGKVVAVTRTDYDGFFLFERVAYGQYRLRVAADSAAAAKILANLNVSATVSPDKSIVRLGAIHVEPAPQLASAQ